MIRKFKDFLNEQILKKDRKPLNHKKLESIKAVNGEDFNFEDLVGYTFKEIKGLEKGSEYVSFKVNNNEYFEMFHQQDCCESVYLEDVEGDINNFINYPILKAEVISENDDEASESGTWTFYKLATIKGYMTIRWYGSSNGYYSESVSFFKNLRKNILFLR